MHDGSHTRRQIETTGQTERERRGSQVYDRIAECNRQSRDTGAEDRQENRSSVRNFRRDEPRQHHRDRETDGEENEKAPRRRVRYAQILFDGEQKGGEDNPRQQIEKSDPGKKHDRRHSPGDVGHPMFQDHYSFYHRRCFLLNNVDESIRIKKVFQSILPRIFAIPWSLSKFTFFIYTSSPGRPIPLGAALPGCGHF
jgi:hypothetical protein